MEKYKIQTIGHYWKSKQEWEILSRDAKKMADQIRADVIEWARIKGKISKLQVVLDDFEETCPKMESEKDLPVKVSIDIQET